MIRAMSRLVVVSLVAVSVIANTGIAMAKYKRPKIESHYFKPVGHLHYEYEGPFVPLRGGKILCLDGMQRQPYTLTDKGQRMTLAEDGKSYGNGWGMVELFDPATGETRVLTKLPFTFGFHDHYWLPSRSTKAVELSDGRIFIVGWFLENRPLEFKKDLHLTPEERRRLGGKAAPLTEPDLFGLIYDWQKGTVEFVKSPEIRARAWTNMCLLEDGRVLIVGGSLGAFSGYNSALSTDDVLIFDPVTKDIKIVGHLLRTRSGHELVPVSSTKFMIFGGWGLSACSLFPGKSFPGAPSYLTKSNCTGDVEVFDLATMESELVGRLLKERTLFNVLKLPKDKILVHGGWTDNPFEQLPVELYDIKSNSSSRISEVQPPSTRADIVWNSPYPTVQGISARLAFKEGAVLFAGADQTLIYHNEDTGEPQRAKERWCEKDLFLVPRMGHDFVTMPDGRVFLMGGRILGFPEWGLEGVATLVEEFTYPALPSLKTKQ